MTAVVLAGGSSTRMGRPKPLVSVAGQPMLQRVLEIVRDAGVESAVVVLGAYASEVRSGVPFREERVVVNRRHNAGMSSSLSAGLRSIPPGTGAVLVVLGDQPFVSSRTLRSLIRAWTAGRGRIFIPTFQGARGNPVLFDRSLVPEAEQITGDVGCRGMFPGHESEIREIAVPDPGILIDVDTPEELRGVEEALAGGDPPEHALLPLVAERVAMHGTNLSAPHRLRRPIPDIRSVAGYIEPQPPKPTLVAVGDSPISLNVAVLGPMLGYRTVLVAPTTPRDRLPEVDEVVKGLDGLAGRLRDPVFGVVATMGKFDESALLELLRTRAVYLGLVASRTRSTAVLEALRQRKVAEVEIGRIRTPAGLDIAAHSPEEVALSILAQITQVRHSTSPADASTRTLDPARKERLERPV